MLSTEQAMTTVVPATSPTGAAHPLLPGLIDAALDAGREVIAVYATHFAVEAKADASPVTEADTRAERVILAHLARLAPGIPVVAEESVAAGRIPAIGRRFFLVDPLDGTREFVSRNGEFTVNIALVEDGRPMLGVVYAPALGTIHAGGPAGAFAADVADGTCGRLAPIRVRVAPEGLVAVASRSHRSPETDALLARLPVATCVGAGSSLKFCLIAAGQADIYPRLSPTMEWDTAAGDAVLRAAGGRVATLDGADLVYGKRDGAKPFLNPDFVALGGVAFP